MVRFLYNPESQRLLVTTYLPNAGKVSIMIRIKWQHI